MGLVHRQFMDMEWLLLCKIPINASLKQSKVEKYSNMRAPSQPTKKMANKDEQKGIKRRAW